MTDPRIHGHTESGQPITDANIETMATEAEQGYEVDELIARRGRRGRPSLGSAPATVESVRLDPELREELTARAAVEGVSASELIRKALRKYLRAG
ncbi:MAG: CopG family transcriptional regulator [Acidimicrobiales bacterium]